ncbi:MAG: putative Zn-dependent protease, partial [Chloroflexi bacterium OLB15]
MFLDSSYLLWVLLPTIIISGLAQLFVRSAYSKWSKVGNSTGLNGVEVAARLNRSSLLNPVQLGEAAPGGAYQPAAMAVVRVGESRGGELSDHFDPGNNTVNLSRGVATQPSIASMAIVAHEFGHVQQYQQKSPLIVARQFLVPAVRFSPMLAGLLIMFGFLFRATGLIWVGIAFFGLTVLFMVLTLPVEIDASRRGLKLLTEAGLMQTDEDRSGSRTVLTAAATTYIAAAVTALLQLLYYISLAQRSSRR